MSLKWVWCPNHNIANPSEKPREFPTATALLLSQQISIRLGLYPMNAGQSKRY